jgi:hypothetical protein
MEKTYRVCGTACLSLMVLIFIGMFEDGNAQSRIQVGTNIRVSSGGENLMHNEVFACSDPQRPGRLLAAAITDYVDRSSPWVTAYISHDAGRSWGLALEAKDIDDDDACAYAPNGDVYLVGTSRGGVGIYQSKDGGKRWSFQAVPPGADRPFVAVDGTEGAYGGNIYISGGLLLRDYDDFSKSVGGIGLLRSVDGGHSFLGPTMRVSISGVQRRATQNGGLVLLSDGTIVSVFDDKVSTQNGDAVGNYKTISSNDGGRSWSDAVQVSRSFSALNISRLSVPRIAVDPGNGVFKDRLYVVWHNSLELSDGDESFVAYSADKGNTWSVPIRFNDIVGTTKETSRHEYQPTVAVNKRGVVGVMWYEGYDLPGGTAYNARFSASLDGGQTWSRSALISESPNTTGASEEWQIRTEIAGVSTGPMIIRFFPDIWEDSGDTAGLTADSDGVFHAFWVDNRTGFKQLWTAMITVPDEPLRNGDQRLAGLDDLTSKVKISITHAKLDRSSKTLSVTLLLKNSSDTAISGPLKLRILDLTSELGTPVVPDTENGMVNVGAILDVSDVAAGDGLKPHQESSEKTLRFKIENLGELRSRGKWHTDLLTLNGRIFGKIQR